MASVCSLFNDRARTAVVFALLAGLLLAGPVLAAPKSLLVVDANTGTVLIDQDGSELRSPASLTKMMTLYLVFEAIDRGSATMKTPIRVSERAADASPSKLGLDEGDTIALEDAIRALITKSANDVAIAIAEHFGGTEEGFARIMTAKARELGMTSTTFKNASGLPDSAQTTTARDMVTLALRLYDTFPRQFGLFSTRAFSYDGRTYKNHNTLMGQMPGINGIKTGYTNASGFNLVTSYQHDGKHLIAAIFGGDSAGSRNTAMRIALLRSIPKASTERTRKPLIIAGARLKPPLPRPAERPRLAATVPPVAQPQSVPIATPALPPVPSPVPARSTSAARQEPIVPPRPVTVTAPRPEDVIAPVVGPKVQMARVKPVDAAPLATVRDAPPVQSPQPPPAGTVAAADVMPLAPLAQGFVPQDRKPLPPPASIAEPVSTPVPMAAVASRLPPQAMAAPGRPPSSLEQQHAALAAGSRTPVVAVAAPSYRLSGPAAQAAAWSPPSGSGAALGTFEIQLGALGTAEEAGRLLASAQSRGGPALAGRLTKVTPVTTNGRTLQRARFTGFDQQTARAACAELQRHQYACLVVRAE